MRKDWVLTKEALDVLLKWLDDDRDNAAREYERIRRRLIRFFLGRRCPPAEELADETINRVTIRVPELTNYQGDKALYFLGVAEFVYLEWGKRPKIIDIDQTHEIIDGSVTREAEEIKDRCLEQCLAELAEDNCTLFIEFNRKEKRAKIEYRKTLADQHGISVNALRIRVHRIRMVLKDCMTKCLEELPAH